MKLLPVVLTIVALTGRSPTPTTEDKYLETIRVSENVYVFKPKIDWVHGNGVAIIGPDGVFFIDTYIQFNYAEEAIRRLKRITNLPVTYVLNTHSHDDHTTGNGVFRRIFPASRLIVQDAAVEGLEHRVKAKVEGEAKFIAANIAQTDSEVTAGKTNGGTPITGSMKAYWDLSLREAREYQRQYRPEKYVSPDITFSDTLAMRWGRLTLKMIHMTENGHSRSDVIVWIPEQRLIVAGDLVVAPTPYYSLPGITNAVHALIALDPAIIIPGHGPIEHDLSYVRLLERAFSTYQRAADSAIAANVPVRQAMDSISFPDIDRAFTGDDEMKTFTYRSFFTRNVFARAYRDAAPPKVSSGPASPNAALGSVATDSEEIALGAALVAQFDLDRGVAPTPQSRRIESYLQSVADSLGRHTNRKLPWKIHYDPHPGIKSGFALPGGHIVIWGGILAYMGTEDEAAAIIAHEIEHTDVGQVAKRLDSLKVAGHRDLRTPSQWKWEEFGVTYGEGPEKLCDYEGAKLAVKAGYSPIGFRTLLESFVALAEVHAPNGPPLRVILDRIDQIDREIITEHWEDKTKTRALRLPN
jgi:glyoxylase-like metal-dependent hydrolase (beta-lactamase superfamily II)